jgi:hypothetical protein
LDNSIDDSPVPVFHELPAAAGHVLPQQVLPAVVPQQVVQPARAQQYQQTLYYVPRFDGTLAAPSPYWVWSNLV